MTAETPLYMAIKNRHEQVIQTLLDRGANTRSVLIRSVMKNDATVFFDVLQHMIDADVTQKVLCFAVMIDAPDARVPLHLIQRYGLDVNRIDKRGDAPLHCAAKFGGVQTLCALLYSGADVDQLNVNGRTPLLCAVDRVIVSNCDVGYRMCDELLKSGADPAVKYNKEPIWKIAGRNARLWDLFEQWGYF